jgi:hypothetical protein
VPPEPPAIATSVPCSPQPAVIRTRRMRGPTQGPTREDRRATPVLGRECRPSAAVLPREGLACRGFPLARSTMNDLLHRKSELRSRCGSDSSSRSECGRSSAPTRRGFDAERRHRQAEERLRVDFRRKDTKTVSSGVVVLRHSRPSITAQSGKSPQLRIGRPATCQPRRSSDRQVPVDIHESHRGHS